MPYRSAILSLCLLIAGAGSAAASVYDRELTVSQVKVTCNSYTYLAEGTLEAPGATGLVDIEIFLEPVKPKGDTLRIRNTIEVEADGNGHFRQFFEDVRKSSKLCGWFEVGGNSRLRDSNYLDIEVLKPANGRIDCCCGKLGDLVWQDLDQDGMQDSGEPGIPDARITMTRPEGMTVETSTDELGLYLFEDLCPGTWSLDVDEATLPEGLSPTLPDVGDDTLDSDGPLDGAPLEIEFIVPKDLTYDFGYVADCSGTIGDFIWDDRNGDGVQDADEPGIPGVTVALLDAAGTELAVDTTDGDGLYLFGGLCAGTYAVENDPSTVPAGLAPTLIDIGDDGSDSDPNPQTVELPTDGSEDRTNDFGFGACGECEGKVTSLSLRFDASAAAWVRVEQKDGEVVFDEFVDPGSVFSFSGTDDGTLGTEIRVLVDNELDAEIHTSCSQPIGPGLVFGSFTVIAGASRDNGLICPLLACAASGEIELDIDNEKVKWRIFNDGEADIELSLLSLVWPADNNDLVEVKLDGATIYDERTPPTSLTITDGWAGSASDRTIESGKDADLELLFDQDAATSADLYGIEIEFVTGCGLAFEPGPGGDWECDKPIDSLTMIWDGGETIDLLAWKGSPGSELLAELTGITVGAEVTVDGYAGSPNDVTWELFSAGGSSIGTSQFHLSCSDDEMDGPEDCGNREGNGKSNEPELINDWLLEGIVDAGGVLDCTPN